MYYTAISKDRSCNCGHYHHSSASAYDCGRSRKWYEVMRLRRRFKAGTIMSVTELAPYEAKTC